MMRHARVFAAGPLGCWLVALPLFAGTVAATEPDSTSTFHISATYHVNVSSAHGNWYGDLVSKTSDMSFYLGMDDPSSICDDVTGCVLFDVAGDVVSFGVATDGRHIVDTAAKKNYLFYSIPEHYKIVDAITVGLGEDGETGIAEPTGLRSIIVETEAESDTWAHEFIHTQGIDNHRTDFCTNAVMYNDWDEEDIRDVINEAERDSLIKNPDEKRFRCKAGTPALCRYIVAYTENGSCTIRFRTDREFEVGEFRVYRQAQAAGNFVLVGSVPPQGGVVSVEYVLGDPSGQVGDAYHVLEVPNGSQREMRIGDCVVTDGPSIAPNDPVWWNPDSLSAVVAGYGSGQGVSQAGEVPTYAILCPDNLAWAAMNYANVWRQRGVDARFVSQSMATEGSGSFRQYIQYAAPLGLRYVLLMGDASDMSLWDDPAAWAWPGWAWPMDRGCDGNLYHPPADSAYNILPTFYYMHHDQPAYYSMTFKTPYYSSDLPYSDVDGDGMGDVIVGRLPVTSSGEIEAYTAKLVDYFSDTQNMIAATLYQVGDARDAAPAASGREAEWYMDAVIDAVPPGIAVSRYYVRGTEYPNTWEYVKTGAMAGVSSGAATFAANQGPGVIVWQDTSSDSYQWSDWNVWARPFDVEGLLIPPRAFVSLGLSCEMANYDMTERESYLDCAQRIVPIAERILLDPARGAIVHIGPTRGSFQRGTGLLGREIVPWLFKEGMSVGEAFRLAQRSCTVKYPEFRDLFREFVLLGDPLIGAGNMNPTGVDMAADSPGTLKLRIVSAHPNPFNGYLTAVVRGGAAQQVSVRVFDISGRLVRRLGSLEVTGGGVVKVVWDGKTQYGREAASGVYFINATSGKEVSSKRVVLMR